MKGRGRPAKAWRLNKVFSFAEHLDTEIKDQFARVLFTEGTAERIADRMLAIAARRDPRYNNYSGNLNRSYMVMARSGNLRSYYVTNPELVPKPEVTRIRVINKAGRRGGKFVKGGRHGIVGGRAQYFRLTFKRHNKGLRALKSRRGGDIQKQYESAKRNRFVRSIKEAEQQYSGEGYVHQYTHLDRRANGDRYEIQSRKTAAHFTLQNLTPYAPFVEAKGFRVLNYSNQNRYRKIVEEEAGKAMAVGVKWLCDQMNRNKSGRFTGKKR